MLVPTAEKTAEKTALGKVKAANADPSAAEVETAAKFVHFPNLESFHLELDGIFFHFPAFWHPAGPKGRKCGLWQWRRR